jgi:cyclic dehypoxanthinyl futalosine synthase
MGITRQQALDCFASDDLIGIGMEADAVRRTLHPEGVVSYIIDRTIDYTGDIETIHNHIRTTLEMGGTGVMIQGRVHPALKIEWFEKLLTGIRQRFPDVWLHCLSAGEILAITENSSLPLNYTIDRLRNAGLNSIPGDVQCSIEDWTTVHRTAHQLGLKTTAALTFGSNETVEERLNFLETVRNLQEETGGFTAFIPTADNIPGPWEEPTAVEYLKTLAISRMFLDNIDNIQTSATNQGLKVLQMALRFGSNDAGSITLEDTRNTEEELRRLIRDAGFKPVQRDTLYRTMFLN